MVDRKIKNLRSDLTKAEQLWLWRQKRGYTQTEAADHLGVTKKQYYKAEAGLKEYDEIKFLAVKLNGNKENNLGLLCRLARRRHGEGLHGTARLFAISHMTLLSRESRADPALITAWEKFGYQF